MPVVPRASSLIQQPSSVAILTDHQNRIRALEALPQTGHYEIKVTADGVAFVAIPDAFIFAIPRDLDTFRLTDAQAYVSVAPFGDPVLVQIRRIRGGGDINMLTTDISIPSGDLTSYDANTRVIDQTDDNDQVLLGDLIAIDIDSNDGDAEGLGVILVFASS